MLCMTSRHASQRLLQTRITGRRFQSKTSGTIVSPRKGVSAMTIKRLPVFACALACLGFLAVSEAEAQQCYRLTCDQSQKCQAQQAETGKCCCNVSCQGGEGGTNCTCTTWCERACGPPCPNCQVCIQSLFAAAEEQGFVLTPAAHDRLRQEHLLAAQVLENLSGRLSHPVYSGTAEGKSNVDSWYDYSYKLRIRAGRTRAVMEFVFDHPEGAPTPRPVRVMVDEFGNVFTTFLSPEEAESVRLEAAATCSEPAVTSPSASISRSAGDG